jgi:hypothetical protein
LPRLRSSECNSAGRIRSNPTVPILPAAAPRPASQGSNALSQFQPDATSGIQVICRIAGISRGLIEVRSRGSPLRGSNAMAQRRRGMKLLNQASAACSRASP